MHVNAVRPLVDTLARIDGKTRQEVFAVWDKAELSVARSSTVCNQGSLLYNQFKNKPNALVTLQGKKTVDVICESFGFQFDVIVTREDSIFRSEQLKMAIQKLEASVSDVLFVGNADTDEAAAKAVGCQFRRV
jgi:phosphoglycolate phosphatase-like HAD superfamily hydrolase